MEANNVKKRIGKQVRYFRLLAGLTQADLAERLDKSIDTISYMEIGKTLPSIVTLEQVAGALGVKLVHIVGEPELKEENYIIKLKSHLNNLNPKQREIIVDVVGNISKGFLS